MSVVDDEVRSSFGMSMPRLMEIAGFVDAALDGHDRMEKDGIWLPLKVDIYKYIKSSMRSQAMLLSHPTGDRVLVLRSPLALVSHSLLDNVLVGIPLLPRLVTSFGLFGVSADD